MDKIDLLLLKLMEKIELSKMSIENEFLYNNGKNLTPISDMAIINPRINKTGLLDNMLVSFVPMSCVGADNGLMNTDKERRLGEVKNGYTPFQQGDVLFAKITPCMENGKMVIVPDLKNNYGFGSTEFHVLRPKDGVCADYLYRHISSRKIRTEAVSYMTGAVGQKRVPARFLANYKISLPSFSEQIKISEKMNTAFSRFDKISQKTKEMEKCVKILKQEMLNKYFTMS
ncbi:MAG: restriction endonuclease subunit S [Candidatus Zeuxoniibacter abyssi]|nr:MAG: restriction endonuclease subunit S [Candidatus Persebacteraceae bacterium AB1(2)]